MKLWIDPLNKADNVVLVNHFFCPPFPPSNVESTENNLNARHQHCVRGRGRGREEIRHFLRVYCLYVPRVLARIVVTNRPRKNIFAQLPCLQEKKSERDRAALFFFKRCIIIPRPTIISSDYASRSLSSIRRVQDGFKRRATTNSLAG